MTDEIVCYSIYHKIGRLCHIIPQVLNGLLSRGDQKEAISIPIGIIPTGSDNSLVWTVLGVKDPISAAITIIKVIEFCC